MKPGFMLKFIVLVNSSPCPTQVFPQMFFIFVKAMHIFFKKTSMYLNVTQGCSL